MMTKLQAHRGVSAEFPENTMVAFQAAADQGYGLIELDPKYTADGQIVMLHDSYLKRTARDADGGIPAASITELTLAQAREFKDVADISGVVLTKMDGTAKGGIAVAIQAELGIPVKYIGVGESIDDLQKFNSDDFVNALFLTEEYYDKRPRYPRLDGLSR